MRPPCPEHKTIYVRFHNVVMQVINAVAEERGIRPATAAMQIVNTYMEDIYFRCHNRIATLSETDLMLSPLSSTFFLQRGRSMRSVAGKPMILTVDKTTERDMELIGASFGMSAQNFRAAIIISYGLAHNLVR